MRISEIKTFCCDAGWRNYRFVKITTEDGIAGWSEFDEGFGSPGVTSVIEQLGRRLVGQDVRHHERFFAEASCLTRPAPGGVVGEGIGAIENALLDAKAKTLGIPCHELLGGKIRDRVKVYWSHAPTWRINHPTFFPPAITDLAGVLELSTLSLESLSYVLIVSVLNLAVLNSSHVVGVLLWQNLAVLDWLNRGVLE